MHRSCSRSVQCSQLTGTCCWQCAHVLQGRQHRSQLLCPSLDTNVSGFWLQVRPFAPLQQSAAAADGGSGSGSGGRSLAEAPAAFSEWTSEPGAAFEGIVDWSTVRRDDPAEEAAVLGAPSLPGRRHPRPCSHLCWLL